VAVISEDILRIIAITELNMDLRIYPRLKEALAGGPG
jgi:hypothetical protein